MLSRELPLLFFREQELLDTPPHKSRFLLRYRYAVRGELPCVRPPAGTSPGSLPIVDRCSRLAGSWIKENRAFRSQLMPGLLDSPGFVALNLSRPARNHDRASVQGRGRSRVPDQHQERRGAGGDDKEGKTP